MVNTNSELNNNKALNTYRLMGIFSQFEINEEIKNALSERLSEDKLFNLFCNKYSKLHGKTKQVKKEFLLVLAYSMKDNFTISDYTNFQQQFDDASSIETVKNGLDILEKISNMTPDGIVKDVIGVPFFDGSSLIKNITFLFRINK